jgi:hypothetical protein
LTIDQDEDSAVGRSAAQFAVWGNHVRRFGGMDLTSLPAVLAGLIVRHLTGT